MAEHLIQTPRELHPELEAAAIRYAAMSPSSFVDGSLFVSARKLRDLDMISSNTWLQVPAGGGIRVTRNSGGTLSACVTLPWQRSTDGRGLGRGQLTKGTSFDFQDFLTTVAAVIGGIGLIVFYGWIIHYTWNLALTAKDPSGRNFWFLVATLDVLGPISYGLFRILRD